MGKKDILLIENLASFEKLINRDGRPYDIDLMVMPGTLEDKHRNVDPEKGIRPLRRQFNLIYLLVAGEHDVLLGADKRWLKPNDLVIVPENMVYASEHIRNCRGYCIHFRTEFMLPVLKRHMTEEFPFLNAETEHIINVSEEQARLIQHSFQDIISEYNKFSYEKDYLLRNFIHILLLRIREIYRPYVREIQGNASRAFHLANKFKHLVEKKFTQNREVRQYADELHISSKYLTEVVTEIFGRPPSKMISEMLLLEAKVLLGSTDKTVTEIAHLLQFEDQAHFSHFIRRHTGLTPLALRKKL
jgi:AraC-like DNA-binding protein